MRLVDDWQSDEKGGISGIAEAVQPRGIPDCDLRYVGSGGSERSQIVYHSLKLHKDLTTRTLNAAPCTLRRPSSR